MNIARVRDLPSLVRNGHFGAGLAHWEHSAGVAHAQLDSGLAASTALINSPTFHATLPAGSWIRQSVDRSDIAVFPSRRYVRNLDATPIGAHTLSLRPSFDTFVDGIPWGPGVDPFAFVDASGTVLVGTGAQVAVEDLVREAQSGPYRVGRVQTDVDHVNSLQISPINGELAKFATSADFVGCTYSRETGQAAVLLSISGLNEFIRDDGKSPGVQPGDVIVTSEPFASAVLVVQVTRNVDGYDILAARIADAPTPPVTDTTGVLATPPITAWFIAPRTRASLLREIGVFQYDFTLAFSHYPQHYSGVPVLEVVDHGGRLLETIPAVTVESGTLFEALSTSDVEDGTGTIFRRRLYHFYLDRREPLAGLLRLTIPAGDNVTRLGDVALYRGNYTRRHDYSDRDDPSVAATPDKRSALDRLVHGADEADGVVPRGAVLLFAGGAQCPPGFKRVDSQRESETDGLELLPAPDVVEYDSERNRTVMTWLNRSFDLLDDSGAPIPVVGDGATAFVTLPSAAPFNGAYEVVATGPVQQRIQPGMALRIRTSTRVGPHARRFDYSVPVRQAVMDRAEILGLAPVTLGSLYAITYPVFMQESDFLAGERFLRPIGPPSGGQPTTYSGVAGVPNPVGTATNRASFSGLSDGAAVLAVTGVTLAPLAVGETVYVRWTATGFSAPAGGFVAVVVSNSSGTVTVKRLDGAGIVTDQSAPLSGLAWFSDARIFDSAVTVTRTVVGSVTVWSARRHRTNFVLSVFGDVTADVTRSNRSGILVEPAGFVRFGDPKVGFDYGSQGHSHQVLRGDAVFNENIAPHVSLGNEGLSSTVVARRHGHGYLPRHTHVVPRFAAFVLCERL